MLSPMQMWQSYGSDRRSVRKCIRYDEQQIHRCGYCIRMASGKDQVRWMHRVRSRLCTQREIEKSENAAALISEKAAEYENFKALPRQRQEEGYVDDIIEAARQENA